MSELAVAARDLTKIYRVYPSPWDRLREALARRPRHRPFHALDGVSFILPRGEGLAVIGENGAGKSTLLKMLAGITTPTRGSLEVRGKVASILELGSGFHPEFTGRQNIVLNAAMLGLSAEELRRRMPDIVAWSELGDFIDQPVKCYSTGMAMRLGFSIATQVDPDVLIIDEALSVGDGYFQKKCMDRLLGFVAAGGTLLFCSHAMYYVSAFCQRALWLRRGRAEALGPVADVVRLYEEFLLAKANPEAPAPAGAVAMAGTPGRSPARPSSALTPATAAPTRPHAPARIVEARVAEREAYAPGGRWELAIEWESADTRLAFHLGVGINRADGVEVCSFASHFDGLAPWSGRRAYQARLVVPSLPLVKGVFAVYIFLLDEEGLHIYDQRLIRQAFRVESPRYSFGLVRADHHWIPDAPSSAAVESVGAHAEHAR